MQKKKHIINKLITAILILLLLPVNLYFPIEIAQAKRIKVVIDPGHGGKDDGAVGRGGLTEKAVNLKVALKLKKYLKGSGIDVIMTRTTDKYLSLSKRVSIANRAKADRFVAIHHNSSTNRRINGTETYVKRRAGRAAVELGREVQKSLVGSLKLTNRRLKKANFYVIKYTKMPSVLIENSFISNPKEESRLKTDKRIDQEARAIYYGLLKHLKLKSVKSALGITGTSISAQNLYFPNVIDKEGIWHTLISIMNTSTVIKSANIKLINPNGSVLKQYIVTIKPKSRYLMRPRKILKTGFDGAVSASTDDNSLVGYVSQVKPDKSTIGLSQAVSPAMEVSFPRVKDSLTAWRSKISVQNTSDVASISVTAEFYSKGNLLATKDLSLKPLQNYDFYPRKILNNDFSGIVKLKSGSPIVGLLTQNDIKAKTLALLPAQTSSNQMIFPSVEDDNLFYRSNIDLANVSESAASYNTQFKDLEGNKLMEKTFNLGANSNYSFSPRKLLGKEFAGMVVITSQQANGAANLMTLNRFNDALGLVEPQLNMQDHYYSFIQDDNLWSSSTSIGNTNQDNFDFSISLFNNNGTLNKQYNETLVSYSGESYFPSLLQSTGFIGPVQISSNTSFSSVLVQTN